MKREIYHDIFNFTSTFSYRKITGFDGFDTEFISNIKKLKKIPAFSYQLRQ
jgi:hypothetical protein